MAPHTLTNMAISNEQGTMVLPVADSLEAVYAVPLQEYPGNPPTIVAWAVGASRSPLRRDVERAIEQLDLSVTVTAVGPAMFRSTVLGNRAAARRDREAALSGTHAAIIRALGQPGVPAHHHALGLSLAADIARHFDAPIFDPVISELRTADEAAAILDRYQRSTHIADWVNVVMTPAGAHLVVSTSGLERFGLPELQTHRVPPELARDWVPVTYAIGAALLERFGLGVMERPAFLELGAEFQVGGVSVRLVPDISADPGATSFLAVTAAAESEDFYFRLAAAVR